MGTCGKGEAGGERGGGPDWGGESDKEHQGEMSVNVCIPGFTKRVKWVWELGQGSDSYPRSCSWLVAELTLQPLNS